MKREIEEDTIFSFFLFGYSFREKEGKGERGEGTQRQPSMAGKKSSKERKNQREARFLNHADCLWLKRGKKEREEKESGSRMR